MISATIHATKLVISRHTCGSILEKNRLHAISATSLANNQAVWGLTCFHTLAKNPMPARNAISPANSLVIWRGMWRNSTLLGLVNERDAQNLFVSKIKAPLEIYFVCLGWDQNRALYRMDCAEKSPKKYLFACEGAHWLWLLWELKTTFGRAYINNLHQTLKGSTFSRHSSHFLFCPVHISSAS